MDNKLWKIGLFTGLTSFVLMILGVRTILGTTLVIENYLAFGVFSLSVGIIASVLLFYNLKIAFRIFMIALVLAFAEFFRSFLMIKSDTASAAGMLSLFIITSFGLGIAVFVQFFIIFIRKNNK